MTTTTTRLLQKAAFVATLAAFAVATFQPSSAYATTNGDTQEELNQATLALKNGQFLASQAGALERSLADALASDHYGLQTSALRLLIAYGESIPVSHRTVHDVVRLYRDHENDQVRRMAVVALAAVNDPWANEFLERSEAYEHAPKVLQTMRAVRIERV